MGRMYLAWHSLSRIFPGACAILAGALADKYGNLRVLLAAWRCTPSVCLACPYQAPKRRSSTPPDYSSAPALQALFGIVLPSIARAVPEEKRARALGIGTAAGFRTALVAPVIASVVDLVGWMQALQYLGLSAFRWRSSAFPCRNSAVITDKTDQGVNQPQRSRPESLFD